MKSERVVKFKDESANWKKSNPDAVSQSSPFAYAIEKVMKQITAFEEKEKKKFFDRLEDLKADHLYVVDPKTKNYILDAAGNKQQSPATLKKYNAEFIKSRDAFEDMMNVSGEYDIDPHYCKKENIPTLTQEQAEAFEGFVTEPPKAE
jgi:hypothetical protein